MKFGIQFEIIWLFALYHAGSKATGGKKPGKKGVAVPHQSPSNGLDWNNSASHKDRSTQIVYSQFN